MSGLLPLAPIRSLLVRDCPFHISDTAIIALRDALEDIIHQIGYSSLGEFERLNCNREQQGVRPLKRLNGYAMRRACDNVLKRDTDIDLGLQSARIVSLGGKNMARHTLVTKSAKKDSDEHGGINGI